MKITIWTVTTDDDDGTQTSVHASKAGADAVATEWMRHAWQRFGVDDTIPEPWDAAYSEVCALSPPGWFDTIAVTEHKLEMAMDPEFQASPEAQAYRDNVDTTDDLETDEGATVSKGDDAGAWVQCWVWVSDKDAGLYPENEEF